MHGNSLQVVEPAANVLPPLSRSEAGKLAADIERAVRSRIGRKVRDLRVEVEVDRVLIRGRCATFYTKQLAQHAAMTLIGEERFINAIEVW